LLALPDLDFVMFALCSSKVEIDSTIEVVEVGACGSKLLGWSRKVVGEVNQRVAASSRCFGS
jgi:hypothetical protein